MQTSKVVLADDHPVFLEGLKSILETHSPPAFRIVGMTNSGTELLHLANIHQPEWIILELSLCEKDGLEVLPALAKRNRNTHLVVLSRYRDPKMVRAAFKSGAEGYLLKDRGPGEILEALRYVQEGQHYLGTGVQVSGKSRSKELHRLSSIGLRFEDRFSKKYRLTKREMEILRLISQALSNKEIAQELYISDQTVSVHRKNIMRKLGVSNTAGLMKAAFEHALV
jgi:DNA-binding NarL/FixJ family response regulator